jgi:hypothetical protein
MPGRRPRGAYDPDVGDRTGRRGVKGALAFVIVASAIGAVIVWTQFRPTAQRSSEPPPSGDVASGETRHFERHGFAFDYPADWQFYPMEMSASFFSTIGYLSSQPIDVEQICIRTANSESCNFRNYEVAPGHIVLEVALWGVPSDPLELWDQPAEGQRMQVAGMPTVFSQEAGPDTVLSTWKIARPDALNNWVQLDADLAAVGQAARIAQMTALIQSFRFDPGPVPLDLGAADQVADLALANLRLQDAEGFRCFPGNGRSVEVEISAAPGAPLREPLLATCSTKITATDLGWWRMDLVVAWGMDGGPLEQRYTTTQWVGGDGSLSMQSSGGDNLPNCCRG